MRYLAAMTMMFLIAVCKMGHAGCLTNGDFEAVPFLSGWEPTNSVYNPVLPHDGLVSGSNTAAFLTSGGAYAAGMYQAIASTGPEWQFDVLFATAGGAKGGFQLLLYGVDRTSIWLQVEADGSVRSDGVDLFGNAPIVNFSFDANSNNSFSDDVDTLNVYALRLLGHFYETPAYDVLLSDANTLSLTHIQTGLIAGSRGTSDFSDGLTCVRFESGSAPSVVDQVAVVPEPSGIVMLETLLAIIFLAATSRVIHRLRCTTRSGSRLAVGC